jgi:hypothetical protein
MSKENYNGWTNYETWLAFTWIQEDEYLVKALERSHARQGQIVEFLCQELDPYEQGLEGFWLDLLTSAYVEINWQEIASHYADDDSNQPTNQPTNN